MLTLILIILGVPLVIILLGALKYWLVDVIGASVKEAARTPPRS